MRNEPNLRIEQFKKAHPLIATLPKTSWGVNYGYFEIPRPAGVVLTVLSSGTSFETGWEHVSVSLRDRCPTWEEMSFVKNLFWREDETVLEFHPKKSRYVNNMSFCLHLWKKLGVDHELPPDICV